MTRCRVGAIPPSRRRDTLIITAQAALPSRRTRLTAGVACRLLCLWGMRCWSLWRLSRSARLLLLRRFLSSGWPAMGKWEELNQARPRLRPTTRQITRGRPGPPGVWTGLERVLDTPDSFTGTRRPDLETSDHRTKTRWRSAAVTGRGQTTTSP